MQDDKLKNYLHLHFIVFIWGFTGVLGKLISLQTLDLIWYRMLFALPMMAVIMYIKKQKFQVDYRTKIKLLLTGVVISINWF